MSEEVKLKYITESYSRKNEMERYECFIRAIKLMSLDEKDEHLKILFALQNEHNLIDKYVSDKEKRDAFCKKYRLKVN
jgi:hypothetical protein